MNALLITSVEQFEPWEESYSRLLEKVGGMESRYYTLDYLKLPIRVFTALKIKINPFAILVEEGGEVVCVLPFQLQNDLPFGLWKTLRFIGDMDARMVNCYPCIIADGFQPKAIDAAVELLNTELVDTWDTMDLCGIRISDENLRYFVSRFEESYEAPSEEEFYYFDASADLDKTLGARKLHNIRRCYRRLQEDFGDIEVVMKPEISEQDMEVFAALHSMRQSGKDDGDAFFKDKHVGGLVRDIFRLCREKGWMRSYTLQSNGQPISMIIVIHTDTMSFAFLTAFDPSYKKYSPSRILMYEMYRREIEEFGVTHIETSWGTNKLKIDFSSGAHQLYDVEIVGNRRKSKTVHRAYNRMEHLVRLPRRCLRRIKRVLAR